MTTPTRSTVRSGAVGFALGVGVGGVLHLLASLGLALLLSGVLERSYWGPRWLMGAALVLVGVAGMLAWARAGRVAAVLAGVGALGVAVVSVWSLDLFQDLPTRPLAPWLLAHVVIVGLVAAAAVALAGPSDGQVRTGAAAFGAVIGTAATGLPDLVEQVTALVRVDVANGSFAAVAHAAAESFLVLAAVLAAIGLLGRVPAVVVAALASASGVLLLVVNVRYAMTTAQWLLESGRGEWGSLALSLAAGFGEAVVVLGLAVVLLLTRGPVDRPAPWQTPTP